MKKFQKQIIMTLLVHRVIASVRRFGKSGNNFGARMLAKMLLSNTYEDTKMLICELVICEPEQYKHVRLSEKNP